MRSSGPQLHPPVVALAVVGAGLLCGAPASLAGPSDADVRRAHDVLLPAAELGARRAGDPDAVQRAYDAARDLQEAVRRAPGASAACRELSAGLARYAAGRVREMEGVDRPAGGDAAAGRRAAVASLAALPSARARCRGAAGGASPPGRLPIAPGDQ